MECKTFGKRPITPGHKCLECPIEMIHKCDLEEIYRNEKITKPEEKEAAREEYEKQIEEMKNDNSCFGAFNFEEEECWKTCEFNLLCLIETGVKPSEECIAFPPTDNKSSENTCWKCIFITKCKAIQKEIEDKKEAKKKSSKMFTGFLSLSEMRESQLEEE